MDDVRLPAMPSALDIDRARLPVAYQHAKHALAQCSRLDECQTWANKAEALASYARQMNDNELRVMADRIQGRAIRRADELLKLIPEGHGARDGKREEGALLPLTRTDAARAAGISEHQQKTAARVGRIPEAEFEAAIESANPPTVTELAERGRQPRPATAVDYLGGRDPADFQQATKLGGALSNLLRDCMDIDIAAAIRGMWSDELDVLKQNVFEAGVLLDRIADHLE